jgi:tRNA (guanine37-N1)-methyltransferase
MYGRIRPVIIDILTLFPDMFNGPFDTGIFNRAVSGGLVEVRLHNIRDYTHDRHHITDDYPFGGGGGMVLKPEPIFEAVEAVIKDRPEAEASPPVILLTPQGRPFTQRIAEELAGEKRLVLICGHYEGVDERVRQHLATDEISIGDYVLSGGEPAAIVVIDAVVRLLPGVLGREASTLGGSHASGLLQFPQYTRPARYRNWKVPEVLLSGDHARIAAWRREQAVSRTARRRPELLETAELTQREGRLAERLKKEGTC